MSILIIVIQENTEILFSRLGADEFHNFIGPRRILDQVDRAWLAELKYLIAAFFELIGRKYLIRRRRIQLQRLHETEH